MVDVDVKVIVPLLVEVSKPVGPNRVIGLLKEILAPTVIVPARL